MTGARKLKKSESLEIRIPYPTKQAFMARCLGEGRTASEALRNFIEGRLAEPQARIRARRRYAVAGALLAALVGAVAAPSLAHQLRSQDALRADFARMDADHDGRITFQEYVRANR